MTRHKQKPSNIDQELVSHCLEDFGSVNSPDCPIVRERSICEGRGITDQLFEFLVQATVERNELEHKVDKDKPKIKNVIRYERATAQIAALSYTVALIKNPYNPDPEKVLADAELEATDRAD